jgi:adenylate cyclase
VMVENDDLYGEGVNIAARLQELAEPGGILISGPVYDMVRNKLSVGFEHLGQQPVKNVTEPVVSYRILLDSDARPAMAATELRPAAAVHAPPHGVAARLWSRFRALPRLVRATLVLVVFLFVIDMSDGLEDIWFHWPAAALGFFVLLWLSLVGHRKKQ